MMLIFVLFNPPTEMIKTFNNFIKWQTIDSITTKALPTNLPINNKFNNSDFPTNGKHQMQWLEKLHQPKWLSHTSLNTIDLYI